MGILSCSHCFDKRNGTLPKQGDCNKVHKALPQRFIELSDDPILGLKFYDEFCEFYMLRILLSYREPRSALLIIGRAFTLLLTLSIAMSISLASACPHASAQVILLSFRSALHISVITSTARTSMLSYLSGSFFPPDSLIAKPIFKDGKKDHYELSIEDTKTENSVRSVPITEETYKELAPHRKRHREEMPKKGYRTNQVFTTNTGSLYDPRSLRHTLDKLHKDAGVPQYGFHVYRHTFGTRLASNGVALQTLSSLMGHSDISVTAKYYINIPETEKIEAIRKLNA